MGIKNWLIIPYCETITKLSYLPKMKLFYFFTAFAAANERAPNTDWIGRLDDLKRIGETCPKNLPLRANQKPVGRHITRKMENAHKKAKKACQRQQQACIDEYGEFKQDGSRAIINGNNACECIVDVMDEYSRFMNHVRQNGISDKGKDHGNQRKRIEAMKWKLVDKLKLKYGCSLYSSYPIFD